MGRRERAHAPLRAQQRAPIPTVHLRQQLRPGPPCAAAHASMRVRACGARLAQASLSYIYVHMREAFEACLKGSKRTHAPRARARSLCVQQEPRLYAAAKRAIRCDDTVVAAAAAARTHDRAQWVGASGSAYCRCTHAHASHHNITNGGYLVDPASSHMLVSKIKPCMSKYKLVYTARLRMAH